MRRHKRIKIIQTRFTYLCVDPKFALFIVTLHEKTVGSYLAKTDIKIAFRMLPVNPQDYHLLGMKWKGQYYYDKCMPMGCSSSCKTFEAFSTAIEWIAQDKLGIGNLLHLLDDFLLIQPTEDQCSTSLLLFLDSCDFLGIPMAPEKTFGPSTILTFAGIELDTVRCESRLPGDKLLKCRQLIPAFFEKEEGNFEGVAVYWITKLCLLSCCARMFIFRVTHSLT